MWWGCHGVDGRSGLDPGRAAHLQTKSPRTNATWHRHRERVEDGQHPADLGHGDEPDVGEAGAAAPRVVGSRPRPHQDHRDTHRDVARDQHRVVELVVVETLEDVVQAQRHHQDADHLHQRRQPHEHVVGVVGRGEPRVVDPRQRDREHRDAEPEQAADDVVLHQCVGELAARDAEGDDQREVVEQLEAWLSGAPGGAPRHPAQPGSRPVMRRRRDLPGPGSLGHGQAIVSPPSTGISLPGDVARGGGGQPHRVAASSRGSPFRPAGTRWHVPGRGSRRGRCRSSPRRRSPARARCTRMPLRPVHCCGEVAGQAASPALDAEYAACGRPPVVMPRIEEMLMMLDPGCMTRPQHCAIQ